MALKKSPKKIVKKATSKTAVKATKLKKSTDTTAKKATKLVQGFKPKIRIENVVASISVEAEIDLDHLAASLPGAEYEPEQFPGLVLRLEDPKSAILVFSSGKMVCTGAKAPTFIKIAIDKTIKLIRSTGIPIKGPPIIKIQNIVASSDLTVELNLDKIAFSLQNAEFEPEQFPGLVFRVENPKVVFLLFRSGKIVCTGAKKRIDLDRGVQKMIAELRRIKVI